MAEIILAIDPGVSGAYAVYDVGRDRLLDVQDLPSTVVRINRKDRRRLDTPAIAELFATHAMLGVDVAFVEAVGGRPMQSASTAYVLGHGVGLVEMGLAAAQIPCVMVPPNRWKGALHVRGKRASVLHAEDHPARVIFDRACDLMPGIEQMIVGARGGKKIDRAEAALIAYFAAHYLVPALKNKAAL